MIKIDETIEKQVDAALLNIEKRRFAQAEKTLTQLLKSHSENHYVNFGIGILYGFQGENKKAISYFQKAVEIFPYFVEAHYNLGIAYHKEINIAGMVRSFQNVLRMGTPGEIYHNEAKRLLASTEKMILDINKTDLHTFIKAQDIFNKGLKLMEDGEWGQAIRLYEDSLALNATTPQPYGNMGICYAMMGRKEEAIEAFDRALAIDPKYELAIANKMITEKLVPGEALDAPMRVIEYYKEYPAENRSYIKELAEEMITKIDCAGEDKEALPQDPD